MPSVTPPSPNEGMAGPIDLRFVSHPSSTMLDNCNHQQSGSDVDRTARDKSIVEAAPTPGGGRNALDTKVVAEGEGPAGEAR